MNTCKIIEFPKICDQRGNLTFLQFPEQIPFEIKRTFWIYNVPGGDFRGGHAYKVQQEIIIAVSGSFDVKIVEKDGSQKKIVLNRSYYGLYLPADTWRQIENFSTNALCLHLSSMEYDESDYVRDINEYFKQVL